MAEGKELARTKAEERHRKLVQIKRQRRTRVSMASGIAFVVLLGAYWIYHSGLFNVTSIDIVGNKYVSAAKIAKACDVTQDTNLLSVSTGEIRERILKDPWVAETKVKRVIPHKLRVEVTERVPVALVAQSGKFYVIDDNKFVIAERKTAEGSDAPIIADLPVDKIRIGSRITHESLDNAIKCLKSMDPSLSKTISLLSASSVDKLSLYNKDNIEVLYGEAKQANEKNKVLLNILKQQGKQVVFIDIRSYPHSDPVLKRMDSVP